MKAQPQAAPMGIGEFKVFIKAAKPLFTIRFSAGKHTTISVAHRAVSALVGNGRYQCIGHISEDGERFFERGLWRQTDMFSRFWLSLPWWSRWPTGLEVWHAGRCAKCRRELTHPDSIARGLGPICAGLINKQSQVGLF